MPPEHKSRLAYNDSSTTCASSLSKYTLQLHSLKLDAIKLARFLQNVEAGYRPSIPYHNVAHATDVLQVRVT